MEEPTTKKPAPRSVTVPLPPDLQAIAMAFDAVRDAVIAAIALGRTGAHSVDIVQRTLPPVLQGAMSLLADGAVHPAVGRVTRVEPVQPRARSARPLIDGMSRCETALLHALALRHPRSSRMEQVLALADYRETGGTSGAIASLRRAEYVVGTAEDLRITDDGLKVLPSRPRVPSNYDERLAFWMARLNTCAQALLRVFINHQGHPVPTEIVLEEAGYKETGGTSGALARLRLLELVDGPRGSPARASKYLLEGP